MTMCVNALIVFWFFEIPRDKWSPRASDCLMGHVIDWNFAKKGDAKSEWLEHLILSVLLIPSDFKWCIHLRVVEVYICIKTLRQLFYHYPDAFLCRLRSIATLRDHFVRRPSVCLSVRLSHFHSYVSQATHAFLGMLPLFCHLSFNHPCNCFRSELLVK